MTGSALKNIVDIVCRRSPFQRKKLDAMMARMDSEYHAKAEALVTDYGAYLESQGMSMEDAVISYVGLCGNMMRWQIEFMRTGVYPASGSASFHNDLYVDTNKMKSYMVGLGISQILWESHYRIYRFFEDYLAAHQNELDSYLEIGPGHGLFLCRAVEIMGKGKNFRAVDISPVSIDISRSIIEFFHVGANADFLVADVMQFPEDRTYDIIVMGEVLEHLDDPAAMLSKLKRLLSRNGVIFVSTCAHCPAIDHVYQFHNIDEIRELFARCGYHIVDEGVHPTEQVSVEDALQRKITVNYCAIIRGSMPDG